MKLSNPPSSELGPSQATPAKCLNCGHPLQGPFCSQCGQEAKEPVPRLRDLLGDVFEELFKFDSKVVRTVRSLVQRPGEITAHYAAGRRADYVAPFKLFFTTSFLFYLLMEIRGDKNASSWGMGQMPGISPQKMAVIEAGTRFFMENSTIFSIFMLPLNAFAIAALFYGRKQPIVLHLVATLHIWSGSILICLPAYVAAEIFLRFVPVIELKVLLGPMYLVFMFGYQYFAFRRLFRASAVESLAKAGAATVWTMILSSLTFVAIIAGFFVADGLSGIRRTAKSQFEQAKQPPSSRSRSGRPDGS